MAMIPPPDSQWQTLLAAAPDLPLWREAECGPQLIRRIVPAALERDPEAIGVPVANGIDQAACDALAARILSYAQMREPDHLPR